MKIEFDKMSKINQIKKRAAEYLGLIDAFNEIQEEHLKKISDSLTKNINNVVDEIADLLIDYIRKDLGTTLILNSHVPFLTKDYLRKKIYNILLEQLNK